jgi:dTMP kinase
MKGIFISFEGPDGAGKSTQIKLLKEHLEKSGFDVLITREPGGTPISEKIRNVILDPENKEMSDVCEAFLYAAARAQLVHQIIIPALNDGKVVIADRFVDSSLVYQGIARGLGEDMIENINRHAIQGQEPDVTFLITVSPEVGLSRKKGDGKLDRLEQENILFHKKVLKGYNDIKNKYERIVPLDGTLEIEELQSLIRKRVDSILNK